MTENIEEMIHFAAEIFLFILAIGMFFILNQGQTDMNAALEASITTGRTVYEDQMVAANTDFTGGQIIFDMREGLEYAVEIDGVAVPLGTDMTLFDFTWIDPRAYYEKIVHRSEVGKIVTITYTKK